MRLASFCKPWACALRRLGQDRRGGVAIFLAVMLVPLIGFVGISIDTARAYFLKARLYQALDAAALAGGRVFFEEDRNQDIKDFFAANLGEDFMDATLSPLGITADQDEGSIEVVASATMDTAFLHLLGQPTVTVSARTVVQRADRGMELVLVLDNTGSMRGSKMNNLRVAAHELVDILYGNRQSIPNFWVSLAPYSATINIDRQNVGWLANGSVEALPYEFPADVVSQDDCQGTNVEWDAAHQTCIIGETTVDATMTEGECGPVGVWHADTNSCVIGDGWKGCVMARLDGEDETDTPPALEPFQPYYWPSWGGIEGDHEPRYTDYLPADIDESEATNTNSKDGIGPNLGCGPEIRPFMTQRTAVEAAVDNMDSWHRGGTATNLGMVWGWRLLSPRWRGLWGPPDMPLDYDEPLTEKVVVVLTDGYNQMYAGHAPSGDSDFSSYDRVSANVLGSTSVNGARQVLNQRMVNICQSMKDEDIVIYAITFSVANNSGGNQIREIFRNCATTPAHYFDSYSGAQLEDAFRTIGQQLSNLRIKE